MATGGVFSGDSLAREIRDLAGRGLHREPPKIGEALRDVLRLPQDASHERVAPYAINAIITATNSLALRLAVPFLVVAGHITPPGLGSEARLSMAAERIHPSTRTARRRADEAALALAGVLRARRHSPEDWALTDASYLADLSAENPRLNLRRRIRSLTDSLNGFEDRFAFPRLAGRPLVVEAIANCRIRANVPLGETARRIEIALSKPLPWGDEIETELEVRPPPTPWNLW